MRDFDNARASTAIAFGTLCLFVGLSQFLYSILAFGFVFLLDALGLGMSITSARGAPPELRQNRDLGETIAVAGLLLSFATIFAGARCFYKRYISRFDFVICTGLCGFLVVVHFSNSMLFAGVVYAALVFAFGVCCLPAEEAARQRNSRWRVD